VLEKREIICMECEKKYDAIMWLGSQINEGLCPECLENYDREE
jgi:hypothetical protein